MKSALNKVLLFLLLSISVFAAKEDYFVTTSWLKENINKENLLVLDARGNKGAFLKGHIPSAILTSWPAFAKMDGKPSTNKVWATLKEKTELEEAIQSVGVNNDSQVIVYTDSLNGFGEGARLLWMLKYVGFQDVKLLDGGIEAWKKDNGALKKLTSTKATKGNFTIKEFNKNLIISTEELAKNINEFAILDVREVEEYNGEKGYGEAKNGRIPGSKNVYYKNFLDENGLLKSKSEVDALLAEAGLDTSKVIVPYCTGGIRSSLGWLTMVTYGYNSRNYDSSFANWVLAGNEIK